MKLQLLCPEKSVAVLLEKTNQNRLVTFLAGSHVRDRCPLGYMLLCL